MVVVVTKYQVRSGGLQPAGSGSCPSPIQKFYLQTFGAYKTKVDIFDATAVLLKSNVFQGLKDGDVEDESYRNTTYTRASYSGRALRDTDGNIIFSGQEERVQEFIDEDSVPGWG
ncbi:MAG TPA: hypothetical protein ENI23_13440 [bacterium]|nr:hypothetical protein [bacterium]